MHLENTNQSNKLRLFKLYVCVYSIYEPPIFKPTLGGKQYITIKTQHKIKQEGGSGHQPQIIHNHIGPIPHNLGPGNTIRSSTLYSISIHKQLALKTSNKTVLLQILSIKLDLGGYDCANIIL